MKQSPFSIIHLLLFIFALSMLMVVVQLGLVTLTLGKLGLTPRFAFLLLFGSLMCSVINLPLYRIQSDRPEAPIEPVFRGLLRYPLRKFTGETIIAINVGGALIPVSFSLYVLILSSLHPGDVILAIFLVTAISYSISRPISGLGIGMPILIAPFSAAFIAIVLNPEQSAPLAYISGTLGVLIGADLLRLKDVRKLGTPLASIGGAGTFDGIFLTGLLAVLLT